MLVFEETGIQGLVLVQPKPYCDDRGMFVKIFQQDIFCQFDNKFDIRESYYSISKKNVLRGMHYQNPPFEHSKLVFVPQGEIYDVVLDMRLDSATFGKTFEVMLSADNRQGIFIPAGFAHGFCVTQEHAMVMYYVSTAHHPEHDMGIRWDSFGHHWRISDPIISERDKHLPRWDTIKSPFGHRSE